MEAAVDGRRVAFGVGVSEAAEAAWDGEGRGGEKGGGL